LNLRWNDRLSPAFVFDGGWFSYSPYVAVRTPATGPLDITIVLRAFGYDPKDIEVNTADGKITWCEIEMAKTPPEKCRQRIEGFVLNEVGGPVAGATVALCFADCSASSGSDLLNAPILRSRTTITDRAGHYEFSGLSAVKYCVAASSTGRKEEITPLGSEPARLDFKIYSDRIASLDYVYQPDGSPRFSGNVRRGQVKAGKGCLSFSSDPIVTEQGRDLRLQMNEGQIEFRHFSYVNEPAGHYDAGAVAFDSVTDADPNACRTTPTDCVVGHVYVVRTWHGHYAKFIVRDIVVQDDVGPGGNPPKGRGGSQAKQP
jgi:hypothetical protein